MGPRAGLDKCGISRPHRDSIPGRPARSQSLYRLSYRPIQRQYVVVNGYETWSVTMREKHRLRVCECVSEKDIWV